MIAMAFHCTIIDTWLGYIGLVGSPEGLCKVIIRMQEAEVSRLIFEGYPDAVESGAAFGDLPDRIYRHLDGERITFDDAVDWSGVSAFGQVVLESARAISYGEVRSYGWLARQMGRPHAARAVGQALARNPDPVVVPCHRVIGSDGRLVGFTCGLEIKRRLLEMEAASK